MVQEEQRSITRLLRWPIALGVLAWLIGSNWQGVRDLMTAGISWPWVATAAGLRMFSIVLATARWDLLLRGQGIELPYIRVFRRFSTGYVCNFLLPGTLGGDVARAGMIAMDSPDRRMRGAATVPVDRLLGLLAFISVGAAAGIWQWPQIPLGILRTCVMLLVLCSIGGLVGLCVLLVVRFPSGNDCQPTETTRAADAEQETASTSSAAMRRRALCEELMYGLGLLRESRRAVLMAFAIALIGHASLSMALYSCRRAFPAAQIPAGALSHLWIVPSAEVPAAVLPLPGGVGAREGALALLYGALSDVPTVSDRYQQIGVVVAATFSMVSVGLAILIAAALALTGGWPLKTERQRSAT